MVRNDYNRSHRVNSRGSQRRDDKICMCLVYATTNWYEYSVGQYSFWATCRIMHSRRRFRFIVGQKSLCWKNPQIVYRQLLEYKSHWNSVYRPATTCCMRMENNISTHIYNVYKERIRRWPMDKRTNEKIKCSNDSVEELMSQVQLKVKNNNGILMKKKK